MNNAKQVDALITGWKNAGKDRAYIAWNTALACVGWPYVFGARGEYCTVQNRHARYSDAHPTIRTACKGYDTGSCSGCKWYPKSERVRFYDCRGFTYWCLKQVGVIISGAGATSQWNTETNWDAKGKVADGIPKDTLVCLFVNKGQKMEHTGFGYNGETCECSAGVQHFTAMKSKWTHWAVPVGLYGSIPEPVPVPEPVPAEGYLKVTGKRVALREDPSLRATIIMRINTGETVKIEDPPPEQWEYVSYKGKKGWMMKQFLST